MFLFHWISILLISVTFYTYSANIVLSCDLAFKFCIVNWLAYSCVLICVNILFVNITLVILLHGKLI